jgi:hypothetical protein
MHESGILWFLEITYVCTTNLKRIKFYFIKLATDFYKQLSHLLGIRSLLLLQIVKIFEITKRSSLLTCSAM